MGKISDIANEHRENAHILSVTAIDPDGCGCTECLVCLYIPLDQVATHPDGERIAVEFARGNIDNHTCYDFWDVVARLDAMFPG